MLTPDIGLAVATCEKDQIRSQNKQLQAAYFYLYMLRHDEYVRYVIFMHAVSILQTSVVKIHIRRG